MKQWQLATAYSPLTHIFSCVGSHMRSPYAQAHRTLHFTSQKHHMHGNWAGNIRRWPSLIGMCTTTHFLFVYMNWVLSGKMMNREKWSSSWVTAKSLPFNKLKRIWIKGRNGTLMYWWCVCMKMAMNGSKWKRDFEPEPKIKTTKTACERREMTKQSLYAFHFVAESKLVPRITEEHTTRPTSSHWRSQQTFSQKYYRHRQQQKLRVSHRERSVLVLASLVVMPTHYVGPFACLCLLGVCVCVCVRAVCFTLSVSGLSAYGCKWVWGVRCIVPMQLERVSVLNRHYSGHVRTRQTNTEISSMCVRPALVCCVWVTVSMCALAKFRFYFSEWD